MQAALALGPIAAILDASSSGFKHYKSGIFDPEDCGTDLNHAVAIVGYSNKSGETPYWIVRNSWGTKWGEDGYMRLKITDGNGSCGINLRPSFPNIHYMSITMSAIIFFVTLVGALLPCWPIFKLKLCKRNSLLFLHEGQRALIVFSYILPPLLLVCSILFAISLAAPTLPIWMCYRLGFILLYAIVHIALCVLHYLMEQLDRATGRALRRISNFGKMKLAVFSTVIFIFALVAFVFQVIENRGFDKYSSVDDSKLRRQHSIGLLRWSMISVDLICITLNILLLHNASQLWNQSRR